MYLRINLPSFPANSRCLGQSERPTYVSLPLSDISQTTRLRYPLRRPRFRLILPPKRLWYACLPTHILAIFISAAYTLVSARNSNSRTEPPAYLTVSGYDLLLNELHNTGRSRRNSHLRTVYGNILPCHLTLPLLYLRIPHRLDKLHSDMPCATLSIKLIPFPISLAIHPLLRPSSIFIRNTGLCSFDVTLRTILVSYLTCTSC